MPTILQTSSTLNIPNLPPLPLQSQILHFKSILTPYLPSTTIQIALWRLPSHLSLPLSLALHTLRHTPIWLNIRWTPSEALDALKPLSPSLCILHHPTDRLPTQHLPTLILHRDNLSHPVLHPLHPSPLPSLPLPPPLPHVAIFFTSGTTARPKPVPLSWPALHLQALTKRREIPYTHATIYLHLTPLFHIGGFSTALALTLVHATHIFPPSNLHISNPAHATSLLDLLTIHSVNTLVLVPTMLQYLIDIAATRTFSSIRTIFYGAAPLSPSLRHLSQSMFPNADIVGAYGMTETASSLTFLHHAALPPTSPLHKSAGWPASHVQLRIADLSDISRCAPDGSPVGEVCTKGPHLMEGYVGGGGVDPDGWFRTGDFGYVDVDSGALFLVGRRKDMIKSAGENVFAPEVEQMLLLCHAVREVAVVGVPHRTLGEAVAAAVVVWGSGENSFQKVVEEMRKLCMGLATFKRPKWFVQQRQLPRTSSGKVRKDVVRVRIQHHVFHPSPKL